MKILQFGKAYPPANLGGVEVVIQLLTEGLNDNDIVCDALGVNDKAEYKKETYKNGTIYRSKLIIKKFSTLFSLQVIQILRKIQNNYDILHVHSPDPMAVIALFLTRPKVPIVLHWHSDILRQKFFLFFYAPLLKWMMRRSSVIIATSPNYIKGSKLLNAFKDKCQVVPIGINIQKFDFKIEENRFIFLKEKNIIFSLGRLAYYKGFEYLILAATLLPEDSIVVIAGEGEEREKLEKIIKNNKLEHKVILPGKITDIEKDFLFKNAKIFALSSIFKTEAYAIVQVEALSYGLPIVSTKIPGSGVDWVNLDNFTGITVEIMNAVELGKAINKIINDKELYTAFSKNALTRYNNELTRDTMIYKTVSIYKDILQINN
ncbi:glycosyltransferase [Chryseobacterium sp. S-02]|uniref:glycosyltransferase n=1 Tax=Chryseobacterium sp. S-02 TaxID=3404064 RepID=UPI003CF9F195